jgi:hypothetical protein
MSPFAYVFISILPCFLLLMCFQIALDFLHTQGRLLHGGIDENAVFVTSNDSQKRSWKLGGLELCHPVDEASADPFSSDIQQLCSMLDSLVIKPFASTAPHLPWKQLTDLISKAKVAGQVLVRDLLSCSIFEHHPILRFHHLLDHLRSLSVEEKDNVTE